jgi:tetrahydromethanopterin S-methyltransferase subunit G
MSEYFNKINEKLDTIESKLDIIYDLFETLKIILKELNKNTE